MNIKLQPTIQSLIDPKIELCTLCKDDIDEWSKRFMLRTIHPGVNKMVSNESSLEFYCTVVDGVREYHSTVLKNVTVVGEFIPPRG